MSGLIASYWTIAGPTHPTAVDEASPYSFERRLTAAAAAGFTGMGLLHADLAKVLQTTPPKQLWRALEAAGLDVLELEVLTDWHLDGTPRVASDAMLDDFVRFAEQVPVRHLKVGGSMTPNSTPLEQVVQNFARVCGRCAAVGMEVSLEFMPFSDIASLADAATIVEQADCANGGLLLDIWHVSRSGAEYDDIRDLAPGAVNYVEVDDADAAVHGTLFEDTIYNRRLCGEGDLDITGFVAAINDVGYTGPVGVEIISREHAELPPERAAVRAFETASKFVEWPT